MPRRRYLGSSGQQLLAFADDGEVELGDDQIAGMACLVEVAPLAGSMNWGNVMVVVEELRV